MSIETPRFLMFVWIHRVIRQLVICASICMKCPCVKFLCVRKLYPLISCSVYIHTIFTVHNSSCGKVMFLHLSVSHSVHDRGRGWCLPLGPGGCTPPRQTPHPLGSHTLHQTATATDGTHPTGTHSCCTIFIH